MFYKLIEKKRNEWLNSNECTVSELLKYIEQRGMMRDAQLEAIKTYLFLKIACGNQPLWKLFTDGRFNDTNIGQVELTETARQIFNTTPAAVARLVRYSTQHPPLLRSSNTHVSKIRTANNLRRNWRNILSSTQTK